MARKLATLRTIDNITPIAGADRIECAHIGGWPTVIGKNEFEINDYIIYFEIDTFLPIKDPRYAFLAPRGTKKMFIDGIETEGHVLRTAQFRGQYSQGLALPLDAFPEVINQLTLTRCALSTLAKEHFDVTALVNVYKYEAPLPIGDATIIGTYDTSIAPKTDAERVQNVPEDIFDLIKNCEYFVSTKVDGTSITITISDDNTIHVFGHNYELDTTQGKGLTALTIAQESGLLAIIQDHPELTFQCELCGPKVQSNRLGLQKQQLFLFSIWDKHNYCYISPYNLLGKQYLQFTTPLIDINLNDFNRDSFLAYAENLRSNVTKNRIDEGMVVHIIGPGTYSYTEWSNIQRQIQNILGQQMQMKAINNKYLLKEK